MTTASGVSNGLSPALTIGLRGPGQRLPCRQLGMTTSQVAAYLGVSPTTVRRWCEKGHLRGYRTPGGQRRFSREQLEAFVVSLAEAGAPGADEHAAPAGRRARVGAPRQPLISVVSLQHELLDD